MAGAKVEDPLPSQAAPDLRLANAAISPMPPHEGDTVEISVTVANVGDATAVSAAIDLVDSRPNGENVSIGQSVLPGPLAPGASAVVETPLFLAIGRGEHTLRIQLGDIMPPEANASNDALSLWMEVLPASVVPPPPPSDGLRAEALETLGLGAFLGFGLVVVGIAIAVALVARRRAPELEPPPPEPPDQSPPPIWPP